MDGRDQNRRLKELNQALRDTGCLEVRFRLYKFSQSLNIFLSNHEDLENAISKHVSYIPLLDYYDPELNAAVSEQLFQIIRHLHNTVAAAQSLVDHTTIFFRRFYRDSNQIPDYQAQIDSRFKNHGLTQFVICLRQFCQHYRNVALTSSLLFDHLHRPHTRIIRLTKHDLLEFGSWKAAAKQFLNGLPEEIDILDILRNYKNHIIEFYNWFMSRLNDIHQEDFATYNRIMDEIELYRPPRFPLAIVPKSND